MKNPIRVVVEEARSGTHARGILFNEESRVSVSQYDRKFTPDDLLAARLALIANRTVEVVRI